MSFFSFKSKSTELIWPGRKAAFRRLLVIALVLFPCTWIVNAFLIGNWNLLGDRDAESYRHLREAGIIFVAAVVIVFLLTLLPGAQRFLKWISNPRTLRRGVIAIVWLVTAIALFYGEEDWRGHRAWTNYSDAQTANGAQLHLKAFVPQPVPDADNFAAIPQIKSWFVRTTNNNAGAFPNALQEDVFAKASTRVSDNATKSLRRITDLVAWQMAFDSLTNRAEPPDSFKSDKFDAESRTKAALAVLDALKPLDSQLEELRAASARPQSIYPVIYDLNNPWGILLPHLADIKGWCARLDLRACAELAAGKSDDALNDVKLCLRLGDSLKAEPFLISYLVRLGILHIAVHSVWEGLAEHRWSDAQLKELETLIQPYDFIADMKFPLDGERAAGLLTADLLAAGKFRLNDIFNDSTPSGGGAANAFGRLMPQGWYDLEKLNYCRLYNLQMDGAFNPQNRTISPRAIQADSKALNEAMGRHNVVTMIFTRHQILSVVLLPALGNVPKRGAIGQAAADQTVIACALERYRLAHGQFSETLDTLAPEFISKLPHEVITGDSYKYRRDKDAFVLYSVGWNETDDGGQIVMKGSSLDPDKGDWVWQSGKVTAPDLPLGGAVSR